MYPIDIRDLAKEILIFLSSRDKEQKDLFPIEINAHKIEDEEQLDLFAERLEEMIGNYNVERQKEAYIANSVTYQDEIKNRGEKDNG